MVEENPSTNIYFSIQTMNSESHLYHPKVHGGKLARYPSAAIFINPVSILEAAPCLGIGPPWQSFNPVSQRKLP